MEICEILGLPIEMVPRFHKRCVYIKRKLQVWRSQKCIAQVWGKTSPSCAGPQTTSFHGGKYRNRNGNMRNFGPTNPHGTAFAPKQWLYQRKLRVWRAENCIALVGAKAVLTSAGLQTTPFHGGQYWDGNGNMRNFGSTNPHGTAFAPKQWLYQRKLRVWRAEKCIALVGAKAVLTSAGPQTTPFHGGQYWDGNGNMRNFGHTNPHGTAFAAKH